MQFCGGRASGRQLTSMYNELNNLAAASFSTIGGSFRWDRPLFATWHHNAAGLDDTLRLPQLDCHSAVALAAAIPAVRATTVPRSGLIYFLNRRALRCWRRFATFSTSNRRNAASTPPSEWASAPRDSPPTARLATTTGTH